MSNFLIGAVGFKDANGNVITPRDPKTGRLVPFHLRLGSGVTATSGIGDDGIGEVVLQSSSGAGSPKTVASLAALRALPDNQVFDGDVWTVQGDPTPFSYSATTGAGFDDDGNSIVRRTATSVGSNGRFYRAATSPVMATIAALRAATSGKHAAVHVQARAALGDGGGGMFDWLSGSTATDDDGTTIAVTGVSSGRWQRRYSQEVRSEWWGLDPTGSTAIDTAFNSKIAPTLAARPSRFLFGKGTFLVAGSGTHGYGLALQNDMHLAGASRAGTKLLRGSGCSQILAGFAVSNVSVRELTLVNGNADPFRGAILIAPNADLVPGGGRSSNIRVENCDFINTQANTASQGFTTLICYFADHVWFSNNYAQRSQLRMSAVRGVVIADNRLDNPYALGMSIVSQTGFSALGDDEIYDVTISGNNITSPQQGGIYIGNDSTSGAGKVSRVRIIGNSIRGAGAVAAIYVRSGLTTEDIVITNNTIDGRTSPFPISAVTYGGSSITVTCPLHGRITGNQTYLTGVAGTSPTTLYTVTFVDIDTFTIAGSFTGPYVAGGTATFASGGHGIYSFDVDDGTGDIRRVTISHNRIANLQNLGIWVNLMHGGDYQICGNTIYKATDTGIRIQCQKFAPSSPIADIQGFVVADNLIQGTNGQGMLIQSGANSVAGAGVLDFDIHDNIIRAPLVAAPAISVSTFQGLIDGHVHHNQLNDSYTETPGTQTYGVTESSHGHLGDISVYYDHNDTKGNATGSILLDNFSLSTIEIAHQTITQPKKGVALADGNQTVQPGTEQAGEYVVPIGLLATTNRTLTLGTTGAPAVKMRAYVTRLDVGAATYAVINGGAGAGTMFTFPADHVARRAAFDWDGTTNWSFAFFEYVGQETIR